MSSNWMCMRDGARYLHCSYELFYALVELGEIPAYEPISARYGGRRTAGSDRRFVSADDLDVFMKQAPSKPRRVMEREQIKREIRDLVYKQSEGISKRIQRSKERKEGAAKC